MIFNSLFTCAGGADEGARQAGLSHGSGVELKPELAQLAEQNGFAVQVEDVRTADFSGFAQQAWLHASTPCTNASLASTQNKETQLDAELAAATVRCIRETSQTWFSLENVYPYRNFKAFGAILDALGELGYSTIFDKLEAQYFGVPQTRTRLFLVASKVSSPKLPTKEASVAGWGKALGELPLGEPLAVAAYKQRIIDRWGASTSDLVWLPSANAKTAKLHDYSSPAPTVTLPKSFGSGGVYRRSTGEHWQVTVEQAAALQTFPKNYCWGSNRTVALTAIGNAVPPELMRRVIVANLGSQQ